MRVSDWLMKRLADEGVGHVFLLPGGGAMHLNDALACETRITPLLVIMNKHLAYLQKHMVVQATRKIQDLVWP